MGFDGTIHFSSIFFLSKKNNTPTTTICGIYVLLICIQIVYGFFFEIVEWTKVKCLVPHYTFRCL